MLVQVVKIEPEQITPFEEVAAEIKRELATERAKARSPTRHDKIEDERAGGSTLTEAAQKLKLAARTIEAIDRSGRDPDGTAGRPACRRRRHARRARSRPSRRRERSAADAGRRLSSGTRSPASRRRASARSTRSRISVETRWREDEIADTPEAPRPTKSSTSSRPARRSPRSRRPTGLKVETASASSAPATAGPLLAAPSSTRSSARRRTPSAAPTGKAGRAHRVPRDRHHRCRRSIRPPPKPSASATRCAADRRGPARPIRRAARERARRDHQSRMRCARRHRRQRRTRTSMQIEPRPRPSRQRYARGEAQVVWTTLVADLETPVSAFLKIAGGRADELPARIGRGRRGARPLFDHRARSRPGLAHATARSAEINRAARSKPDAFAPCAEPPLAALRALIAESRIELPEELPPMAAGVFGYLGYDMVRLMEELPPPNPDPIGIPDAILMRPTVVIVFDAVKDAITVVTPVRPEAGVTRAGRLQRAPASGSPRSSMRSTARSTRSRRRRRAGPLDGAADLQHDAGRIQARWCCARQGVHRRRRHLPGGAVAALRGAVRAAAVRALPRAAAGQPGAVPLLPRLRRLRGRRLEPGNSGARARRHGDDPPDRRHAAARRHAARGQGAARTSCSPIRRSAPST